MTSPMRIQTSSVVGNSSTLPQQPAVSIEDELGWLSILRVVRRRFWLIALIAIATSLAALPAIMALEKTYYGQVRLLIKETPTLTLAGEALKTSNQLNVQTEIERMVARDTSQIIIDRFALAERAEFNPDLQPLTILDRAADALIALLPADPEFDDENFLDEPFDETETMERVYGAYVSSLAASRHGATDVVTIGFHSQDPRLAADVPNALVEIHSARHEDTWQAQIDRALAWLELRMTTARARLSESEQALQALRDDSGIVSISATEDTKVRLELLEAQHATLFRDRLELQESLNSIEASRENLDLPSIAEPTTIRELRRALRNQSREIDNMSATFGSNYGGLAALHQRVLTLRTEMLSELDAHRESIQAQFDFAAEREQVIEEQVVELRTMLVEQRLAEPELERLTRTMEEQESALSILEDRQQDLIAASHVPPLQIDVLSPATLPLYPEGISRKLLLVAAMAAGAVLGLTAAAVLELLDRGIRGHEQLAYLPQFVPAGLIPLVHPKEKNTVLDAIRLRKSTSITEALRDTAFLLECANGGSFPSSMLVAHAGPDHTSAGEWVAAELSASGRQVNLVELSTPSSEVLPLASNSSDSVDGAARRATTEYLDYQKTALSGDPTRDPVARNAMEKLLETRSEGRITIIDGPFIQDGTALRIAQKVDAVLIVMQWGKTTKPAAELVAGLLTKSNIGQAFTLIVDVNPKKHIQYGFTDRLSLSKTLKGAKA